MPRPPSTALIFFEMTDMKFSICLAAAAIALCGCAKTCGIKEAAFASGESRAEIECRACETFAATLPSNPTTGYGWAADCPAGVKFLGKKYLPDGGGEKLCGSGGIERFEFAAPSKGECEIKFEYRRPWEKDATPADTKILKVKIN